MAELGSSPEVMSVEESELVDSPSSAAWEAPVPPGIVVPGEVALGTISSPPIVSRPATTSHPPVLPPSSPGVEVVRWVCLAFDGLMVALLVWVALAVLLQPGALPEQSANVAIPLSVGTGLLAAALGFAALALYRRKPWAWWPQVGLTLVVLVPVISVISGVLSG